MIKTKEVHLGRVRRSQDPGQTAPTYFSRVDGWGLTSSVDGCFLEMDRSVVEAADRAHREQLRVREVINHIVSYLDGRKNGLGNYSFGPEHRAALMEMVNRL